MLIEKTIKILQQIIIGALLLIFSISKIVDSIELFNKLFSENVILGIQIIILIIVNLGWIAYWFFFGLQEVEFLGKHMLLNEKELGPNKFMLFVAPIVLAIILGLLLSNIFYLQIYIPILISLYLIVNFLDNVFTKLISNEISKYLLHPELLSEIERQYFISIKNYYLGTFYFTKTLIATIFLGTAFLIISIKFNIGNIKPLNLGYLLTTLGILINEIPLLIWRNKRNKSLENISN